MHIQKHDITTAEGQPLGGCVPVWDFESAINGSLEAAEDACAGGGDGQAHVQVAAEGAGLAILALHHVLISVDLLVTSVDAVKFELLKDLQYTSRYSVRSYEINIEKKCQMLMISTYNFGIIIGSDAFLYSQH